MLRLAEARGLPIHQKPAKTRFHELKMRLSPFSSSDSLTQFYGSISMDLKDTSPWIIFRGCIKMLRLAWARGLRINQKPAKTRFHELKMRLSPFSTSDSLIKIYGSIGLD